MKKWYRIFYLQWDSDKGELTPVIDSKLDNKSNWYKTIEDAENVIMIILKANISRRYTILPIYEYE